MAVLPSCRASSSAGWPDARCRRRSLPGDRGAHARLVGPGRAPAVALLLRDAGAQGQRAQGGQDPAGAAQAGAGRRSARGPAADRLRVCGCREAARRCRQPSGSAPTCTARRLGYPVCQTVRRPQPACLLAQMGVRKGKALAAHACQGQPSSAPADCTSQVAECLTEPQTTRVAVATGRKQRSNRQAGPAAAASAPPRPLLTGVRAGV